MTARKPLRENAIAIENRIRGLLHNCGLKRGIVGVVITAGSSYFVQIENVAGNLKNVPNNTISQSFRGDARALTASGEGTKVFAKDWSSGTALFSGPGESAKAVWGTGPSGTKVVGIAGDSIIYGIQDSTAGTANITGDADGALGFANRALNAARYSSVRTAIADTKASEVYANGGRLFVCWRCDMPLP